VQMKILTMEDVVLGNAELNGEGTTRTDVAAVFSNHE
jgi:hypothetical protein